MILRKGLLILFEEIGDYWIRRLEGTGLNLLGIHPFWGVHAAKILNDSIQYMNDPQKKKFFNEVKRMGIDLEFEMHAVSWLLPRNQFDAHPDWFRMNEKGDRVNDFNLCPSNKDALDYIKERAQFLAQLFVPTTNRYYFWLDDVKNASCRCGECRKFTPSDQAMLVYNAILQGIRKVIPEATHCYLAYHDTLTPPARVEPEDGIFLEFAPIERDSSVPINDRDNIKNASETASIRDLISCFGSRNSQILEYWIDNSRFSNWKKPPQKLMLNTEVLKRDIEYYSSLGFESITSFGCFLAEDYYKLHGEPPIKEYGRILDSYAK